MAAANSLLRTLGVGVLAVFASHFRNAIAQAKASTPPKAKVQKASPHNAKAGIMSSAMPNAMGNTEPPPTPKIDRRPSARPSCDAGTASVIADESTGRNASERRANFEKDHALADPTTLSGTDTAGTVAGF